MRRDLKLKDAKGVNCLPNATIFEQLTLMGYEKLSQKLTFYKAFFSPQWKFLIHMILQCLSAKTTAWNEFSSTIASAIICLAKNQKFNFSKYIFESMVKNLDNVANDAINEEMDDSLVRAATTASSLEAEQDSGFITKTQSKATPNEAGSLVTTSGGGPRRQDTIGDTIAQNRFENVSKTSNDSLLVRVNTPRSDEDRLQLKELMELCTNLQQRLLDLENAKTAQAQEITSLKLRVKRLEKKRGSRTHKLKRLYRVGPSRRVESSEDKDDTQERYGDDMFDTSVLDDEEVFEGQDVDEIRNVAKKEVGTTDPVTTAGEVVTTASVEVPIITNQGTTTTTLPTTTTIVATTIIAASTRPKAKGIVIQEQVQAPTPTVSSQQSSHVKDKGKAKMVKPEPVKKISKKDQIMLDEELALKLQAKEEEEEEERLAREKAQQVEEANISWDNMQAILDVDYQMAQRLQAQEQEELSIKE
ncbi:hypothetical protein Tco_0907299 [Tanacetum coccineum]|uniref:Synaptobrevin, longin-like domain protein n=1 Tax=Tanacetum coccineum TaxID=301880 RepID=A0ABQ5CQC5_9ASTR